MAKKINKYLNHFKRAVKATNCAFDQTHLFTTPLLCYVYMLEVDVGNGHHVIKIQVTRMHGSKAK